jgi:hypothetical protein
MTKRRDASSTVEERRLSAALQPDQNYGALAPEVVND